MSQGAMVDQEKKKGFRLLISSKRTFLGIPVNLLHDFLNGCIFIVLEGERERQLPSAGSLPTHLL